MRILLVDDDDAILQSLAAVLKTLPGHDLRLATSGEEALKHAEEMGGVDLMISDVVMDPMDGFALRDAVTERYAGARTIFITGYDLSDYAEQTQNHQLLQKPFEPADLVAAVRTELGDAATAAPVAEAAPAAAAPVEPPAPAPSAPAPAPTPEPEPAPVAVAPPAPAAPAPVEPEPAPAPELVAPTPETKPEPAPVAVTPPPAPVPEPPTLPTPAPAIPAQEKPATPEPAPKVAAVSAPVAVPVAPSAPSAPSAPAAPAAPGVPRVPGAPGVPVARPSSPSAPQAAPSQAVPVARPVTQQPTAVPRQAGVPAPTARAAQPAAPNTPSAAPGQPRGVARPVAGQPTAVPSPAGPQAPRATAVPAATAVPKAIPATPAPAAASAAPNATVQIAAPGTPVKAGPTAVPAPNAVAKAKSTQKMPAPTATAVPVAKAAPVAPVAPAAPGTPVAKPVAAAPSAAVPVAKPATAVPAAKVAAPAVAKAAPTPVGKVSAAPQVKPAPAAAPVRPAGPAAPAAPGAAAPLAPTPPDTSNLPAKTIGAYDIHHRLGVGRWGAVYAAVQTAINRPVALKILDPERAKDEVAVQNFTANARAKASVQHPSILAVYEAGEQDGHIFYTREYVAGRNLAEVESSGGKIDEPTALKILRVVGEGLAYFQTQNTPHAPLEARSIYVGTDSQPRLANLASQADEPQQSFQQQVQTLGKVLLSVLPAAQTLSPGLRTLLSRMVQTAEGNPKSFPAWAPILQAVKSLEPQVVPVEAAKISAGDRAAVAAVEAARKAQQRSIYFTIGSAVSLLALVGGLVWWFMIRGGEREHDELVHIPGGDFLFQNGEPATVPEFWIDKYEVTIGQYAEFLKDLDEHPRGQYPDFYEKIEHMNQPPLKRVEGGHRPPNWHIFYPRAKGKMEVAGTPTSLDSPVVEVDWWSAYAYAKWRGRELPTEQEWEKAARGTKGFIYPWGEEADPKRVNSGADYNNGNPAAKAEIDGSIRYGDVDKIDKDKSPFGVIGMAGNVSEWILDWAVGPDKRTKFPMVKGGNFRDPDVKLDRRITDRRPDATHDWLGFRTVSHSAPKK